MPFEVQMATGSTAMTRVSNQTNNLDPTSVNSRVFVGNLNTYAVAKEDVENVFARYGRVIGISMHKGYAFVQFTDCYDARNAVLGEDGRTIAGQVLDVNMVTEPKPHQLTRKRRSSPRQSSEVSLLEGGRLPRSVPHSSCSSVLSSPSSSCALAMTPPNSKRIRTGPPPTPMETALFMHGAFNGATRGKGRPPKAQPAVVGLPFYCSEPDVLVCGVCKQLFSCLQGLLDHKRRPCRLRFTCRCQDTGPAMNAPSTPQCAQCDAQCASWWDLVCHAEEAHGTIIYRHEEETEPSHRPISVSPGPDCSETRIQTVHSVSSLGVGGSSNSVLIGGNNAASAVSGNRVNGVKAEIDDVGDNNRIPCNSEDSNSEEDQSDNSKLPVEVSHDKCVDTTDLLIG